MMKAKGIVRYRRFKGMSIVILLGVVIGFCIVSGCDGKIPAAPDQLRKAECGASYCCILWNDNSNDESGFNIYVGGSCADCNSNTAWNKIAGTSANTRSYNWSESCCDVAECSCVMVRAYNGNGESSNSNVVMLAPLC
jgi:hypothetical protein